MLLALDLAVKGGLLLAAALGRQRVSRGAPPRQFLRTLRNAVQRCDDYRAKSVRLLDFGSSTSCYLPDIDFSHSGDLP